VVLKLATAQTGRSCQFNPTLQNRVNGLYQELVRLCDLEDCWAHNTGLKCCGRAACISVVHRFVGEVSEVLGSCMKLGECLAKLRFVWIVRWWIQRSKSLGGQITMESGLMNWKIWVEVWGVVSPRLNHKKKLNYGSVTLDCLFWYFLWSYSKAQLFILFASLNEDLPIFGVVFLNNSFWFVVFILSYGGCVV